MSVIGLAFGCCLSAIFLVVAIVGPGRCFDEVNDWWISRQVCPAGGRNCRECKRIRDEPVVSIGVVPPSALLTGPTNDPERVKRRFLDAVERDKGRLMVLPDDGPVIEPPCDDCQWVNAGTVGDPDRMMLERPCRAHRPRLGVTTEEAAEGLRAFADAVWRDPTADTPRQLYARHYERYWKTGDPDDLAAMLEHVTPEDK